MHATQALAKTLEMLKQEYPCRGAHVLDVGAGAGNHAEAFRTHGHNVTAIDIGSKRDDTEAISLADYRKREPGRIFDVVWCSHVLEHQVNVHSFLTHLRHSARHGGLVAITVPPLKDDIVGGHVTLWNQGLLLYNMVLAGFDCSKASVGRYGYNVSVIVRRVDFELPPLRLDQGDLLKLRAAFPAAYQGEPARGNGPSVKW